MTKNIPKKLPKHYVVVDTNVLWQEDKLDVVSKDFTRFWDEYAGKYDLELVIVEVVRGELLYQHTSVAMKKLARANAQFSDLAKLTGQPYKHKHTSKRLKTAITKRIDKWIKNVKALVLVTPIDNIDWSNLIKKAVWREKPFEEDRKTEKGFRDVLIYETIRDFTNKVNNIDIALITNDGLLREAVNEGLKKVHNLNSFQKLDEFESYLKLVDEELTNTFVRAITEKANLKFFNHATQKGLLFREGIRNKILKDFTSDLSPPTYQVSATSLLAGIAQPKFPLVAVAKPAWRSHGSIGIWIGRTLFTHKVGESEFHWVNKIFYTELYKYYSDASKGLVDAAQNRQVNLLEVEFSIHWSSFVKSDARFYKIKFGKIEKTNSKFKIPSSDEVKNYKLDILTKD